MIRTLLLYSFFFFNDTATTEIYTLSLHDALPICAARSARNWASASTQARRAFSDSWGPLRPASNREGSSKVTDRKSTRLNSSHGYISYAVFCLKKKKQNHSHCEYTIAST